MFDGDESDEQVEVEEGAVEIKQQLAERKQIMEAKSEVYHKSLMKSGDTIKYHFSEFPSIRTDEDYLEFIPGEAVLSFSESKMSYQPMNLPKSLTKLDTDTLSDTAIQLYKAILEYAGDVTYPYPNTRARYILTTLMKTPELHVELYLQLMKHLTDSRNPVSEDRTWGLLCLTTYNIPVTEELAPYILNFLLAYKSVFGLVGHYARLCMRNIEGRMVLGATETIPTQTEIDSYSQRPPMLASIDIIGQQGQSIEIPVLPSDKVEDLLVHLILPTTDIEEEDWYLYGLYYSSVSSTEKLPLRKRLERYYKKYNPEKLEQVDYFVDTWGDNVDGLFRKLEMRYGPEPPELEDIQEPSVKKTKEKTMFKKSLTMAKKAAKQIKKNAKQIQKRLGFTTTFIPKTDTLLCKEAHLGDLLLRLVQEGKSPVFILKRKLFKNERLEFDEVILEQAKYDFFNNNLNVMFLEDAIKAVTMELVLRNDMTVLDTVGGLTKFDAKKLIPVQFLAEHQPADLYEMILNEMARFKNMELIKKNLNFSFFEICQKQLTFNMGLFTSTEKNGRKKLTILGVNKDGVNILKKDRSALTILYKFVTIKEYAAEGDMFTMKVVTKDETDGRLIDTTFSYKTKDAQALYELIYDYTYNFEKLGLK